jgi:hypothetical protein
VRECDTFPDHRVLALRCVRVDSSGTVATAFSTEINAGSPRCAFATTLNVVRWRQLILAIRGSSRIEAARRLHESNTNARRLSDTIRDD